MKKRHTQNSKRNKKHTKLESIGSLLLPSSGSRCYCKKKKVICLKFGPLCICQLRSNQNWMQRFHVHSDNRSLQWKSLFSECHALHPFTLYSMNSHHLMFMFSLLTNLSFLADNFQFTLQFAAPLTSEYSLWHAENAFQRFCFVHFFLSLMHRVHGCIAASHWRAIVQL